jgi:hypothetical protein
MVPNKVLKVHWLKEPEYPIIRGESFLEAGYIYAPYIPITTTQTIYDSNDFTPSESIMSRYSRRVVDNRFYGTISVNDLNETN